MTLRITDPSQLEHLSPTVRKQVEGALGDTPASGPGASSEGGKRKRARRPEQDAGKLLVQWVDAYKILDPALDAWITVGDYFAHTPNGGFRSPIEAAIFIGQGLRPAWPDYTLYMPRGRWHGAVLELKAVDGGKPTDEQLDTLSRLERMGYKPIIAWGFEAARDGLLAYLALNNGERHHVRES